MNVARLKEEQCVCMYGTKQSLLLKGLNRSVTLRECGCSPVFAIAGFLLAHLKQLMLTAKEYKIKWAMCLMRYAVSV